MNSVTFALCVPKTTFIRVAAWLDMSGHICLTFKVCLTRWQSSAGVPSYDLRAMVEALIEVPKFVGKLLLPCKLGWLCTF